MKFPVSSFSFLVSCFRFSDCSPSRLLACSPSSRLFDSSTRLMCCRKLPADSEIALEQELIVMAGQDGPANSGIIAREAESARAAISAALSERGLTPRGPIDIRPVPFAGTWGVASSVAHQLAGDLAMAELEAAGKLEGLSRKEAKQLAGAATREKAQSLAV